MDERENGGKRMVGGKEKVEESLWLDEENEVMQGVVKQKKDQGKLEKKCVGKFLYWNETRKNEKKVKMKE